MNVSYCQANAVSFWKFSILCFHNLHQLTTGIKITALRLMREMVIFQKAVGRSLQADDVDNDCLSGAHVFVEYMTYK